MRSRVLAPEAVGIAAESGIESGFVRGGKGVGLARREAVPGHCFVAGGAAGVVVPARQCTTAE